MTGHSFFWQPALLIGLALFGILLHFSGLLDWQELLYWAQRYGEHWWLPPLLILVQISLFTLALPGSAVLWIVAPLYPPPYATLILTVGSSLGALSANLFARRESLRWSARVKSTHLFRLLESRSDFLSLCAVRLFPAVPHSVINYGAGLLRLPLGTFVSSTVLGLAIKSFLYSHAINSAISAKNMTDLIHAGTLIPLILLAVLAVLGDVLQRRWTRLHKQNGDKNSDNNR